MTKRQSASSPSFFKTAISMADWIIKVENLRKVYRLRHQQERQRYVALRDVIADRFKRLYQAPRPAPPTIEDFWALKGVSFEIKQGEVLGIIGRNGAGKSTLLKILSRITPPSAGRVRLRGRVASLLEVGTGFHPELTGRENVFLNGAILGMTRAEIKRKFDEIVAFADVEKFLDTPVKRYSSGMYVRLAFAVAAHLEPEILVVDEVLAVGDAEFQKRCLGKMHDVSTAGRTVLFVSHNMAAIRTLCSRGVLLSKGEVVFVGSADGCIREYEHTGRDPFASGWTRPPNKTIGTLGFTSITAQLTGSQPNLRLRIECSLAGNSSDHRTMLALDILDATGTPIMQALPSLEPFVVSKNSRPRVCVEVQLPPLVPNIYSVTAWIGPHNTEIFDLVENCVSFTVHDSPTEGRTVPHTPDHGFLVPPSTFVEIAE
jgi:lipopolysaccharide transport system ATP-binding protein